jgi:hypothetical protein
MAVFSRFSEVQFNGQTVLFGDLSPAQQQQVLDADYQAEYEALYGRPAPTAGQLSTGDWTGQDVQDNTNSGPGYGTLEEPPGTEFEFTDLAEPVDPDADPELLAGEEDFEFTELAEPVDEDADPELLGGPEEDFELTELAEPVDPDADPELELLGGPDEEEEGLVQLGGPTDDDDGSVSAAATAAKLAQAQQQATIQQRYNQTTQGDWRVRLRLAPGANYLYNDPSNRLLAPLRVSNGVIFPYTPTISTNFTANYDKYDLTHSNYRGYFYKNSNVGDISVNGTFTAQDTAEAEYLLAVIVFLRSATKMFYGKDEFKGAPPPLVELSGYGQYQFNNHPCLIQSFNYSLPNDVDYIRVTPNNQGINLSNRQNRVSSSPISTIQSILNRLQNAGLPRGAVASPGDLGVVNSTVAGLGQSTYVPTKMEIQLTLLPVQTREQVSKQFSVKNFSNGNLLKGGFW